MQSEFGGEELAKELSHSVRGTGNPSPNEPVVALHVLVHVGVMNSNFPAFLSLPLLLSAGCSITEEELEDERRKVSEMIEAAVKLPEDALPLHRYERYYANSDSGVLAVYTVHSADHRQFVQEHCRTIDEAPFPCPLSGGELMLVDPGESAWIDNPAEMPSKDGGGCSHVNILYSPDRQKFVRVECNASY